VRRALPTLLALVWSLWLGGLVVLFLSVHSLFITFASDYTIAGEAASGIFTRFNRYQLVLAGLALVGSFLWRISSARSAVTGLFFCFGLASFAAIVAAHAATRLEGMRLAYQTHTPEFVRLHGLSMLLYLGEAVSLLIGGMLLPYLIRRIAQDEIRGFGVQVSGLRKERVKGEE
jgi:hypothetical protein